MTRRSAAAAAPAAADWQSSIVRVGRGRGFVLRNPHTFGMKAMCGNVIVTAAHCLPRLPRPMIEDHPRFQVIRPFADRKCSTSPLYAECLFVDPVADVAVLGSPAPEVLEPFEDFLERCGAVRLGVVKPNTNSPGKRPLIPVWLLDLNEQWHQCEAEGHGARLVIRGDAAAVAPGTSGSPVFSESGDAIGVVVLNCAVNGEHYHGAATVLAEALPGALLKAFRRKAGE